MITAGKIVLTEWDFCFVDFSRSARDCDEDGGADEEVSGRLQGSTSSGRDVYFPLTSVSTGNQKGFTFVAFDVFNGGAVGLYLNLTVVWHITQHTPTEVWTT